MEETKLMDLNEVGARAAGRWIHPIAGHLDLDRAHADVMGCVSELRLVRAQMSSLLLGLGVRVGDNAWVMDPESWRKLGERIHRDILAVGLTDGAHGEGASRS